jgi:hypothetical protein
MGLYHSKQDVWSQKAFNLWPAGQIRSTYSMLTNNKIIHAHQKIILKLVMEAMFSNQNYIMYFRPYCTFFWEMT